MAEWFNMFDGDPAGYICSHPRSVFKDCTPKKVEECCLVISGGKPCPFLVPEMACEGRSDVPVKTTRLSRKIFPGD